MNFETIIRESYRTQARKGAIVITYKPRGFWSETINLSIRRDFLRINREDVMVKWKAHIITSSGGRNSEVECDLEAYSYYAEALASAVNLGNQLVSLEGDWEKYYQEEQGLRKQREQEGEQEKRDRINADPHLGVTLAKQMVQELKRLSEGGWLARIGVIPRGADGDGGLFIIASCKTRTTFRISGRSPISREKLIEELIYSSSRTRLEIPDGNGGWTTTLGGK